VFASLVDADKGGHFRIAPDRDDFVSRQLYLPGTAILITRFMTPDGVGEVRDFMPVITGKAAERHRLVRVLTVPRGTMRFAMDLQPRFDYGRQAPTLTISDRGAMFEEEGSGGMRLTLHTVGRGGAGNGDGEGVQVRNQGDGLQATWTLGQGEATGVVLESMGGQPRRLAPSELARMFDTTSLFWHNWLDRSTYTGRWREIVSRSAVTLKLMTYAPTGAPVAAPTAGLPGQIGGERNWDYRYT
jgi:GH15 family glucan-1,4-alpha-glucosidase